MSFNVNMVLAREVASRDLKEVAAEVQYLLSLGGESAAYIQRAFPSMGNWEQDLEKALDEDLSEVEDILRRMGLQTVNSEGVLWFFLEDTEPGRREMTLTLLDDEGNDLYFGSRNEEMGGFDARELEFVVEGRTKPSYDSEVIVRGIKEALKDWGKERLQGAQVLVEVLDRLYKTKASITYDKRRNEYTVEGDSYVILRVDSESESKVVIDLPRERYFYSSDNPSNLFRVVMNLITDEE